MAKNGINPAKGLILTGTSILQLKAGGVTVKDSKSFLPMALAALPKAFGLVELKKGFFPYKFDTPENVDYSGPWPAAQFYMPNRMVRQKKEEFETWYIDQKNKVSGKVLA